MIPRLLAVFFVLLLAAVPLMAQPGSIGVFADPAGSNYGIDDSFTGLLSVYVVHVFTLGATAAQFAIPHPWCFEAIYLGEAPTATYISTGTARTGITISYGACTPSPNMILTLHYFAQGTTPNCCCLYVIPDANANPQKILVADCSDPPQLLVASGGLAVINQDIGCMANMCGTVDCLNTKPVPVEDTSWGAIKMLYSNQ